MGRLSHRPDAQALRLGPVKDPGASPCVTFLPAFRPHSSPNLTMGREAGNNPPKGARTLKFRRLAAAIMALCIGLSTMAASAPQSAQTITQDANPAATCTAGSDTSTGFVWDRGNGGQFGDDIPGTTDGITSASLDIVARALEPCWPGTNNSKSLLLVSIEGTISGVKNFPQLGICKFRNLEDQTHFCLMQPGSDGNPTILNSSFPPGPISQNVPIGGHTYRFEITRVNKAQPGHGYLWYWRYTVTDLTFADVILNYDSQFVGSGRLLSNPDLIGGAWYGCETGNDDNALGTLGTDLRALMSRAGYRYQGGGSTWFYTQNSNVYSPTAGSWNGHYADQHFTQDQNGLLNTDRVGCYTQ